MWKKTLFSYIPVLNLTISTVAFGFQIMIINPTQKKINSQNTEIINLLQRKDEWKDEWKDEKKDE